MWIDGYSLFILPIHNSWILAKDINTISRAKLLNREVLTSMILPPPFIFLKHTLF